MRVIVYGAGAVGGVIGAKLFQRDHDVTLIARGANLAALCANGIRLETREEQVTLRVPVVEDPSALTIAPDDIVILAVKSQDTLGVLSRLVASVPPSTSIICAQNGVENERAALRCFERVYGMYVMCQAIHLAPGVVKIPASPATAILDVGRWPTGIDEQAIELATLLNGASFNSLVRDDIARWKWGKLLRNLGNVVEALCGSQSRGGELSQRALQEGIGVLTAAGIDFADGDENLQRRQGLLNLEGPEFGGGSSWQSLERRTGSIETDYLTGEIVLQGRLLGMRTPVNTLLQRLAGVMARERLLPGAWTESDIVAQIRE